MVKPPPPKDVELQAPDAPAPQRPPAQYAYVQRLRVHYARRRRYELVACAMGVMGIALMLLENELIMADKERASPTRRHLLLGLKIATLVTTLVLDGLILLHYATTTEILKMENAVPTSTNFFLARWPRILLELALCSFHVPPGVDGGVAIRQFYSALHGGTEAETEALRTASCETNLGFPLTQVGRDCFLEYTYPVEALGVFMVVRLYLFGRYLRSASSLYSQWVAFVGSLNDINAMKPFFHFKALFKIRPLHLLIPLTLLNTFLTAAIIRILEEPVQASFENYSKAVWLTAVTMSATGFGDYYPVTYLGRAFTTVGAMFSGVLLVALIQSLFFGVLELSPKEEKVKFLIDLDKWERQGQHNAATTIQAAWRRRCTQSVSREAATQRLFACVREARRLRACRPEMSLSLEEQIAEAEQAVVVQLQRMEDEQAAILARIQAKSAQIMELRQRLAHRERGAARSNERVRQQHAKK